MDEGIIRMSDAELRIKILIVDDHKLTRIGLETTFKNSPDIIVAGQAANGAEAIDAARQLMPDVILLDLAMPVLDGIEAAKLIRQDMPEIHIIMLSSHDSEKEIFASLAAGVSGYCLKDVEPERLCAAVRAVKSGDLWLDASIAHKVLTQCKGPLENEIAQKCEGSHAKSAPDSCEELKLYEPLSPREKQVLELIVEGLNNQQIAEKLLVSRATAKTHVRNILNKLSVNDRTKAAVLALKHGLVH